MLRIQPCSRAVSAVLLATVLTGCATMTPEECQVANWYLIGEMDAREGRSPSYFADRARACNEAGHPADQESWYEGWEHGLSWFCTSIPGYRYGREGKRYEPICPVSLEPEFLRAYDLGRQTHAQEAAVSDLVRQLEGVDRSLRDGNKNDSLSEEEVAVLRRRQQALRRELREAELQLAELNGVARGRGLQ